jgi:hypothetical protein
MLQVPHRIKPAQGYSHLAHIALNLALPIVAYILVRTNFVTVAVLLVLMSKWRMLAVQPRYWLVNLIANGVDIMVGVSAVLFMASTASGWWQLIWAMLYAVWLVWLKPRSGVLSVSAQAMVGQLLGLSILYLKLGDSSLTTLVLGTWLITYISARHFLASFDEAHTALLAHAWAYFSASLAFVLGHWLLFYGSIAQIIVLLTNIGYGLAAMYYLDAKDRLNPGLQRQLLVIMCAILIIVILFSDWTGSTV